MSQKKTLVDLLNDYTTSVAASYFYAKGFDTHEMPDDLIGAFNKSYKKDIDFLSESGFEIDKLSIEDISRISSIWDSSINKEEFMDQYKIQQNPSYNVERDFQEFKVKQLSDKQYLLQFAGDILFAAGKVALGAAALTGGAVILDNFTPNAHAQNIAGLDTMLGPILTADTPIDPFTFLQPHYEWTSYVTDPANGAWGKIEGATALDANTWMMIYGGGNVSLFNKGSFTPYLSFPTGGSTGLSRVDPAKYPGEIAVTGTYSILFYDRDGNFKGERAVQSSKITDITYDREHDQIWVSTNDRGTGPLKSDGSIEYYLSGAEDINYLAFNANLDGIPIKSMFQANYVFWKFNPKVGYNTDLGADGDMAGSVFFDNITIVASRFDTEDYLLIYPAMSFAPYINFGSTDPVLINPLPETIPSPTIYKEITNPVPNNGLMTGLAPAGEDIIVTFPNEIGSFNLANPQYVQFQTEDLSNLTGIDSVIGPEGTLYNASTNDSIVPLYHNFNQADPTLVDKTITETRSFQGKNYVATENGVELLNPDGTTSMYKSGKTGGFYFIDSPDGKNDLFFHNNLVYLLDSNGNPTGEGKETGFGNSDMQSMMITKYNGIAYAVVSDGNKITLYDAPYLNDLVSDNGYQIPLVADFDNNGTVDATDFEKLLTEWLEFNPDMNNDGIVNYVDFNRMVKAGIPSSNILAYMQDYWLTKGNPLMYDLNGDNYVNMKDYTIFSKQFGKGN